MQTGQGQRHFQTLIDNRLAIAQRLMWLQSTAAYGTSANLLLWELLGYALIANVTLI